MRSFAIFLAIVCASIATACGGPAAPGGSQTASVPTTPSPPSSVDETAQGEVPGACALMPLSDVEARSPFTTPLVTADDERPGAISGFCAYDSSIYAETNARITLTVDGGPTAANPMAAFQQLQQDCADQGGVTPVAMPGIGEMAFGCPEPDGTTVRAVVRNYLLTVNLKGEWNTGVVPDVGVPARFAAATEILQLLIPRLP